MATKIDKQMFDAWYRQTYEQDPPTLRSERQVNAWLLGMRIETPEEYLRRLMVAVKRRHMPAEELTPDKTRACRRCQQKPSVPLTGLCGPCSFADPNTKGGNWWHGKKHPLENDKEN